MILIIQIVISIVICAVVPILLGDLLIPQEALGKQYIMGFLCSLAISQALFIPFIVFQHSFTPYYYVFITVIGVLCILSIVLRHSNYLNRIKMLLNIKALIGDVNLWMILAVLLIGIQVIRVAVGHFFLYADNATYIPIINDILETDKDYYLDHIMGVPGHREINRKYLFTTYFPYLAAICKFSGLHPAILVQTVLPPMLTIITYVLVWHYGIVLFKDKRQSWMLVLFFGILAETIGGYDHTQANSVVSGIYFGKKIVFLLFIPFVLLFIAEKYSLLEDRLTKLPVRDLLLLIMMVTGVCAPSLMGTGLIPIALFSMGMVLSIRKKSLFPMIQMVLSMIPAIAMLLVVVVYLYFWS